MTPIPFSIQVTQVKFSLKAGHSTSQTTGDFAGNEGFTTPLGFMVKQNTIAGIHAVGLTIVHRDPIGIELGNTIG